MSNYFHNAESDNSELINIIDAVSNEKALPRETIFEIMERVIEIAAKKKYGMNNDIRSEISRRTGEIRLFKVIKVVENPVDLNNEMSLEDAVKQNPEFKIDDEIMQELPPIDTKRSIAQSVKTILIERVKAAEKEKEYEEFKQKIGEVLIGVVKGVEKGDLIIDINKAEAILKKDQMIRGESFKPGDRIKIYLKSIVRNNFGPQIILSRTDIGMLAKLLELEVPEIYDKVIEIKAIARDPGSKSKIAVISKDVSLDAVGCCIGVRGSRIRNVSNELNGEKIDVLLWSSDIAQFTINALSPAQVLRVIINQDKNRIEVITYKEQLSLAIGKGGQNIKLASKLVDMKIDVMTQEEESTKRTDEFNNTSAMFIEKLDIEEIMAQLLTANGYSSIEMIANASISNLANIEGFDEELAEALKERATEYLENEQN
jgi:transcription termination/antitermination protein NusA